MTAGHRLLVGVHELAAHLSDPGWCVFDCRHDLTNRDFGRTVYAQAHVPGAMFLHLDQDLSGPMTGMNGRHPLPDPEQLARRLAACGVDHDSQVVAYDDAGGMFAARLWWLMRWLGHDKVALLDGGLRAWSEASQPLIAAPPAPRTGNFRPTLTPLWVDAAYVEEHLEQPGMTLIDARGPDRFRGENETLDPVGGHIPGAINRFFKDNLDADGRFKAPSRLRDEFVPLLGTAPATEVVHQCGSGVTACHNVLAMELAGLHGSRLYPGSWSEWCANPSRPVATGV
ncbi:MAG: sulfurtransferase [Rhodocyclales bacterium]|nr:sulfurtransferase [Rhodocyclales bacterium]